jgi:exo-beta-1,3-glucanase (GH17 family)
MNIRNLLFKAQVPGGAPSETTSLLPGSAHTKPSRSFLYFYTSIFVAACLAAAIYGVIKSIASKNDSTNDSACQDFLNLSCNYTSDATTKAINYDPLHSMAFRKAQSLNDVSGMEASVSDDMMNIIALGFNAIKTFYAAYATADGQAMLNIGHYIGEHFSTLKSYLGVYIFTEKDGCESSCADWTDAGYEAAMSAINQHPEKILGLIIGNEDQDQPSTKAEIVKYAHDAKARFPHLPVGTAQTTGSVATIAKDPNDPLVQAVDFVGVNIYPYWANRQWGSEAQSYYWNSLSSIGRSLCSNHPGTDLIVTEEGWPSNFGGNIQQQRDYFTWSQDGHAMGECSDIDRPHGSVYFQAFDKLITTNVEGYWGLLTSSGTQKVLGKINDLIVHFSNTLEDPALVLACDHGDDTPTCWPIYGKGNPSIISLNGAADFKLDLSVFAFIWMFSMPVDTQKPLPACVVDRNALVDRARIDITWSADGRGQSRCGNTRQPRAGRHPLVSSYTLWHDGERTRVPPLRANQSGLSM